MKTCRLLGVAVIALACFSSLLADSAYVFFDLPLDAALKKADSKKKIVLIDFFTTWCWPCKMLDRNTWTDAKVKALLAEETVALRVDAEKESSLSNRAARDRSKN